MLLYQYDVATSQGGVTNESLPKWGWGTSIDLTVSTIDGGKGYAEETGVIRYNGQKLPFLAQGEAGGLEASFSMQNVYAIKTLNGFTGINDFKGGTISFKGGTASSQIPIW